MSPGWRDNYTQIVRNEIGLLESTCAYVVIFIPSRDQIAIFVEYKAVTVLL